MQWIHFCIFNKDNWATLVFLMPQSVLLWQPVLRVNNQTTHQNVLHLSAVYRSFLPQLRGWHTTAHRPSTALPPVLHVVWWASSRMPWSTPDSARAQVCAQSGVVATQTTQPAKQRMSVIQPCTGTVCRPRDWTNSSWKKGTASSVSKLMSSEGQDGSWSRHPERTCLLVSHKVINLPLIETHALSSTINSKRQPSSMQTQTILWFILRC